jgi:deoxycytidylate deaminase
MEESIAPAAVSGHKRSVPDESSSTLEEDQTSVERSSTQGDSKESKKRAKPRSKVSMSSSSVVDMKALIDGDRPHRLPFSHIFMNLALDLTKRTSDPNTGVGCVIVNKHCQILGIGYNAESKDTPAEDAADNVEELMVHAEANAICHSNTNLMGEEIYVFVTRQPCEQCMKILCQYDVQAIFYLNFAGYNSFRIARYKGVPMVQYSAIYQYDFDDKSSITDWRSCHNVCVTADKISYDGDVAAPAPKLVKCKSCNCNFIPSLACKSCKKDSRLKAPPAVTIPIELIKQWAKIFHIHDSRILMQPTPVLHSVQKRKKI